MRSFIFLSALAVGLTLAPPVVQAQTCPRNATRASMQMWPAGSLLPGQSVTGTHPCGRRITCIGGRPNVIGSRSCSWG